MLLQFLLKILNDEGCIGEQIWPPNLALYFLQIPTDFLRQPKNFSLTVSLSCSALYYIYIYQLNLSGFFGLSPLYPTSTP